MTPEKLNEEGRKLFADNKYAEETLDRILKEKKERPTKMPTFEAEGENHKSPAPQGFPTHKSSTRERCTVAYFTPDGDVTVRYEYADMKQMGSTLLAQQAFMVIRVLPSRNGAEPQVEFLKARNVNFEMLLKSVTKAYVDTPDEIENDPDDPKNHEIDCTCIMCIPGN